MNWRNDIILYFCWFVHFGIPEFPVDMGDGEKITEYEFDLMRINKMEQEIRSVRLEFLKQRVIGTMMEKFVPDINPLKGGAVQNELDNGKNNSAD